MSSDTSGIAQRFGSGRDVRRLGDEGLLKGLGQFTDDIRLPDELRLVFVRSPYPHARIAAIDAAAARSMPGVVAVMTGAELVAAGVKHIPGNRDFKRAGGEPGATPLRRVLAHERVRFVGEAVALVVAETLQQARDAAEAVAVEYEELPHVTDPVAATAPGAPAMCDEAPDNIAAEMRHGDARGRSRGLRAGRACGQAAHRQPAAGRPADRAALGAGLDRRRRTPDSAHEHPDAFRRARLAVQGHPRAAAGKGARDRGRCGRRLRHEDRHLP